MTAPPGVSTLPEQPGRDGRLVRSARTRRVIVDAMRSLHQDGDLRPTAARVAERAGVSLRTVWQHFADLESLLVEAGRRDFEIAASHTTPIDVHQPLVRRLEQLVEQRGALFEAIAPVWRAARLQEPFSEQIQRNRDRLVDVGRNQLEHLFADELRTTPEEERRTTLHALQVATNWATWESLRNDLGLTPADAQRAVVTLVSKLLITH